MEEIESVDFEFLKRRNFQLTDLVVTKYSVIHFTGQENSLEIFGGADFENCKFDTLIINGISSEDFLLNFYKIECKDLRVLDCKLRSFDLEECVFTKLSFYDSTIGSISGANFSVKILNIMGVKSDSVSLECSIASTIEKIKISSPEIEEFDLKAVSTVGSLECYSLMKGYFAGNFKKATIYGGEFELIAFENLAAEDKSKIDHFRMIDVKLTGTVEISDYHIENLQLNQIHGQTGSIILNETVCTDTMIEGSIFGKFYCNQLTFLKNPQISRSDVTNFVLNNLVWNSGYRLNNIEDPVPIPGLYRLRRKYISKTIREIDEFEVVELRAAKDTYRQLKLASQRNGNDLMAMQFYSNEMSMFWKEIRIAGGVNWQDRLLIFMQRWSSNFGQSWALPLLWLAVGHFILFSCLMNWYFGNFLPGEKEFGYLWVTLNPVHKSLDVVTSGTGMFTEFCLRLFDGYFIYHFVKVTRKFGKGN